MFYFESPFHFILHSEAHSCENTSEMSTSWCLFALRCDSWHFGTNCFHKSYVSEWLLHVPPSYPWNDNRWSVLIKTDQSCSVRFTLWPHRNCSDSYRIKRCPFPIAFIGGTATEMLSVRFDSKDDFSLAYSCSPFTIDFSIFILHHVGIYFKYLGLFF